VVLKAKRKRDLKCIKSTSESFFLFVERELLHTTPGKRKKILKKIKTFGSEKKGEKKFMHTKKRGAFFPSKKASRYTTLI